MEYLPHGGTHTWGQTTIGEFISLMCGECLGSGCSREVFVFRLDPTKVIKVEMWAGMFHNVTEWHVWQEVKGTRWEKWFAPCWNISPCGTILLQERTSPLQSAPKRIPSFFTDVGSSNWGTLEGRPVCHDYGYNDLLTGGFRQGRMRPVSKDTFGLAA